MENKSNTIIDSIIEKGKEVFNLMDMTSNEVKFLEKTLQQLNINFPYEFFCYSNISEKPAQSDLKTCSDEQITYINCSYSPLYRTEGYYSEYENYLAWDLNPNQEQYRLMLKGYSLKIIRLLNTEDKSEIEVEYSRDLCYQKPLMETKLETRIQMIKYINKFYEGFNDHLDELKEKMIKQFERIG